MPDLNMTLIQFAIALPLMHRTEHLSLNGKSSAGFCRQDSVLALPTNLPFPLAHVLRTVIMVSCTLFHIAWLAERLDVADVVPNHRRSLVSIKYIIAFLNHTFRGTGITVFLNNDGSLAAAQDISNQSDPRTTKLYNRRKELANLSEIERRIAF